MSAIALTVTKPPVRAGDIVLYLRTARRMLVESVERRSAFVAWMDETGNVQRACFSVDWLVPKGMALA